MKIAIVCGHFLPSMGYIEVHLANAFYKLGHEIRVITTDVIPNYVSQIGTIEDALVSYDIVRLKPSFSLGQMVKSNQLVNSVKNFNPQLVITIGVGKLFPMPLYQLKNRSFRLMTLLGDNAENHFASGSSIQSLKNKLLLKFVKQKVYQKAIKSSDIILPYSPSTIEFVSTFIKKKFVNELKNKSHQISFIYNEDNFYLNKEERESQRNVFGLKQTDSLLITITRIVPEKEIEKTVDLVNELNEKGIDIYYLIVGFQDNEYCNGLDNYIKSKKFSHKIIRKPFSEIDQVRKYYNAADIALFTRRTISLVEALATGLAVMLPKQKNLANSLTDNSGLYYNKLNEKVIAKAVELSKTSRTKRAENAKQFSNTNLATHILNLMKT